MGGSNDEKVNRQRVDLEHGVNPVAERLFFPLNLVIVPHPLFILNLKLKIQSSLRTRP